MNKILFTTIYISRLNHFCCPDTGKRPIPGNQSEKAQHNTFRTNKLEGSLHLRKEPTTIYHRGKGDHSNFVPM